MSNIGQNSQPSNTTTPRWLGSVVFRPNSDVSLNTYNVVIWTDLLLLIGLWLFLPSIIPSPRDVLHSLSDLINNEGLIGELFTSLTLNIQAITLSTIISLLISYAAAIPAFRPLAQLIAKGRFLSLIGLSFLMTIFLGGGHALKLALLTFGMSVFFVTSMVDVVLQVPSATLDYVRTLRAGEWRVVFEAQVLGTLGSAFDIIRQNAAMGWLMLTMVEGLVRSEGGIGRMLLDQEKHFSLSAIFAVQLVFVLVGVGQDMLIAYLKTLFAPSSVLAYTKDRK